MKCPICKTVELDNLTEQDLGMTMSFMGQMVTMEYECPCCQHKFKLSPEQRKKLEGEPKRTANSSETVEDIVARCMEDVDSSQPISEQLSDIALALLNESRKV